MVLPHQGHLEAALYIMSHLSLHHNSRLCMDPNYPNIDILQFPVCDWREFYGDIEEPIPPNAPKAIRKEIIQSMFVNSDHTGYQCT